MNETEKKETALAQQQPDRAGFNFLDPAQFDTMQRVCKLFASSELVPDLYKVTEKNPIEKAMANCMIALEIAQRIGASPLMVMQNMVPIYGRPSWSSKFLVATVNTCGRFAPLQYKFSEKGMLGVVDYTDYVWDTQSRCKKAVVKQFDGKKIMDIECVAFTTAKGKPNDVLMSSPVSVRLAIQEGWYTKNGSKWPTMTRQMLMYRAASMWTNAYAPELSMGMRTVEEQQDIMDIEFDEVPAAEKALADTKTTIGMPEMAGGAETVNEDGKDESKESGNAGDAKVESVSTSDQAEAERKTEKTPGF